MPLPPSVPRDELHQRRIHSVIPPPMKERGDATRGKVGELVSGASAIEIKVTISHHQVQTALERFGLTVDNDEERLIYFFDTPALDLNKAGIIARARRVIGDAHDCTVKLRPVVPERVARKWYKFPDFKIEADASETSVTKSASFTMPVAKGVIKRVAAGNKAVDAIFTDEQRRFVLGMASRKIDFSKVVVLGPLRAHRWKFEDPGCPWPITAELWVREDNATMMEMSIKALAVQAAAAIGGFMAFLAEVGAERDTEEQAKTRWALDYYAGRLAKQKPAKARETRSKPAPLRRSTKRK